MYKDLYIVVYTCIPTTWEAETGQVPRVQGQAGVHENLPQKQTTSRRTRDKQTASNQGIVFMFSTACYVGLFYSL